MTTFVYEVSDLAGTAQLGAALAEALPDGAVVSLDGPLGAGKTNLVQTIATANGVPADAVTSPTFVLINEYAGRRPIYHLDAYRLKDDDEFLALGPEEYFESAGITLIEWGQRVVNCLPRDRLEIRIFVTGESTRKFEIQSLGPKHELVIEKLMAWSRGVE